jgi:hypothetical protein
MKSMTDVLFGGINTGLEKQTPSGPRAFYSKA